MRFTWLSLFILPLLVSAGTEEQQILNPQVEMVEPYTPATTSKPTLADLLTIEPAASIFYSYARELELSERFADANTYSTVLAPSNKAVMALARKPHQGPKPVDDTVIISEKEFDEQTKRNVQRWVASHIIPETPVSFPSSESYPTLLDDKSVQFSEINGRGDAPAWSRVQIEDGIHIIGMKEVSAITLPHLDKCYKY
ncbi:hypothetical protein NLI96_g8233 [Meripilus lineatus]|uniref:FAS1 domain-containing protein n=1 Tax=Meripilus lineatus TaxID=2056292 RepID=A0AAD5YBA3_9APHY|nr:hypothetical protein NLI96_g8233 [Physisporinus lineatus]